VKVFVVIGSILFLLYAFGKVDVEFWARAESDSSPASIGPPTLYLPSSAGLGVGRRTADTRWIRRMNALCLRRNGLENRLDDSGVSATSAARFAARTLWIWDDYQRRAASVRAPTTYAREAGWVQQVDAEKRRGIEAALEGARREDVNAANAAVLTLARFSHASYSGFARIGLTDCAQFRA